MSRIAFFFKHPREHLHQVLLLRVLLFMARRPAVTGKFNAINFPVNMPAAFHKFNWHEPLFPLSRYFGGQ
jgi:hypothetical protein